MWSIRHLRLSELEVLGRSIGRPRVAPHNGAGQSGWLTQFLVGEPETKNGWKDVMRVPSGWVGDSDCGLALVGACVVERKLAESVCQPRTKGDDQTSLSWGSMLASPDETNANPAYEAVLTEPANIRPDNPCRRLNGRMRRALDGQSKRFGRQYRIPTGALDQCSTGTDILGFPGDDALRALDSDRVLDVKSFAFTFLLIMLMDCCHGTHLMEG